jgi:hypothetical protein
MHRRAGPGRRGHRLQLLSVLLISLLADGAGRESSPSAAISDESAVRLGIRGQLERGDRDLRAGQHGNC